MHKSYPQYQKFPKIVRNVINSKCFKCKCYIKAGRLMIKPQTCEKWCIWCYNQRIYAKILRKNPRFIELQR